jgi:hypothetical protein
MTKKVGILAGVLWCAGSSVATRLASADQVVPHDIPAGGAQKFLAQPVREQGAPVDPAEPTTKVELTTQCRTKTGKIAGPRDKGYEACLHEQTPQDPGNQRAGVGAGISTKVQK